jgi:hypothetical protein
MTTTLSLTILVVAAKSIFLNRSSFRIVATR